MRLSALVSLLAIPGLAAPALAHHSFAPVDLNQQITLEGDVVEFQWTNPHCWIEIDVPGADGERVHWSIQLNSPNQLTRQGWTRTDLAAGDHVVLVISPLRSGQLGGVLRRVTLADGSEREFAYSQAGGDPNRRTVP